MSSPSISLHDFSYATPERSIGTRELSMIPHELYYHIFSFIEPTEEITLLECKVTYAKLARVCRLFASIALPLVYRSLVFSGKWDDRDVPSQEAVTEFCKRLTDNQQSDLYAELAQKVHDCTLENWSAERMEQAFSVWNYIDGMAMMPNLEVLTIRNVEISGPFVTALEHLTKSRNLTSKQIRLRLVQCKYHRASVNAKAVKQLFADTCRSMLQVYDGDDELIDIVAQHRLESLAPLQTLELSTILPNMVHQLPGLLKATPSLTSLAFSSVYLHFKSFPLLNIDPSALPNLRSLRCPVLLLSSFASCIPMLTALHIGPGTVLDVNRFLPLAESCDLRELLQSAGRVIDLSIVYHPVDLPMNVLFPSLETLSIRTKTINPQNVLQVASDHRPKGANVRELRVEVDSYRYPAFSADLVTQHGIVMSLMQLYPNLHKVMLTDLITWIRMPDSKGWRPLIPHQQTKRLHELLSGGHEHLKDYNGFFTAMLESGRKGLPEFLCTRALARLRSQNASFLVSVC